MQGKVLVWNIGGSCNIEHPSGTHLKIESHEFSYAHKRSPVSQSFWNFVSQPCSVQHFKTIWQLKLMLWTNLIKQVFSLRRFFRDMPYIAIFTGHPSRVSVITKDSVCYPNMTLHGVPRRLQSTINISHESYCPTINNMQNTNHDKTTAMMKYLYTIPIEDGVCVLWHIHV